MTGHGFARELVARVTDRQVGPCRLIVLPFEADGVVSIAGSFASGHDCASGEDLLHALVNAMLDKGTRRRDQFEVAQMLESVGASRSYAVTTTRSRFSGRCLKKAVGTLLGVVAEELREPLLDDQQFEMLRQRSLGRLRQSLQNTAVLASDALARHWFEIDHPNYARLVQSEVAAVDSADIESIRSFHSAHFGSDDLIIVIVGDIKPGLAEVIVARAFGGWREARSIPSFSVRGRARARLKREDIYVADKASVDVMAGVGVPIDRNHPDYIPLYLGTFILGGNFSSRLMQRVRDELGLTYGISAGLTGVSVHHDMLWRTHVTLSSDSVDAGVDETLAIVRETCRIGVTRAELERAKETVVGAYLVRHDTTSSLASTLLADAERRYPVSQLAEYPLLIQAVALDDVNRAMSTYIRPDDVSVVAAGSLPSAT